MKMFVRAIAIIGTSTLGVFALAAGGSPLAVGIACGVSSFVAYMLIAISDTL